MWLPAFAAGLSSLRPALGLVFLDHINNAGELNLLGRALAASLKRVRATHEDGMHDVGLGRAGAGGRASRRRPAAGKREGVAERFEGCDRDQGFAPGPKI
jgi:hypothetical protein